jgi:hypothetical protein
MNLRVLARTPKVLVQKEYVVLFSVFLKSHESLDLLTKSLNIIVTSNFFLGSSFAGVVRRSNFDRHGPPFLVEASWRRKTMSTAKYRPEAAYS